MKDFENLIPDLKNWKKENGDNFDIQDWIACEGDIKLAIGFSTIFWPDFVKHDDCIILESRFSRENFDNWLKEDYTKTYSQIESVLNHIHLVDLFSWEKQQDINIHQIRYLGNVMSQIYKTKLKSDFPDREFTIYFNGDENFEDIYDYEISFYQPINDSRKI